MKKTLIIAVLLIYTLSISAQINKISTSKIEKDLIEYGVDSVISSFSWAQAPLYKIDMALYTQMIGHIDSYSSPNRHFVFDGANSIQNPLLADKTLQLVGEYTSGIKQTAIDSKYKKVKTIDEDDYILVLTKQNHDSVESFFKSEYDFWKKATEINNKKESHYNCLKMMLALKELNSPNYSESAENFHRQNVKKSSKDRILRGYRYIYEYKEYETSIIDLKNEYNKLEDVNFDEETDLSKVLGALNTYYNDDKCWSQLIYNDNKGILDLGCQHGFLSGHGGRYMIELVGKNKLKIASLESWIS